MNDRSRLIDSFQDTLKISEGGHLEAETIRAKSTNKVYSEDFISDTAALFSLFKSRIKNILEATRDNEVDVIILGAF